MRPTLTMTCALFVSLVVSGRAGMAGHAQTGAVLTAVAKDGRTPMPNVRVDVVDNGQPRTLGKTDAAGQLRLDADIIANWNQLAFAERQCLAEEGSADDRRRETERILLLLRDALAPTERELSEAREANYDKIMCRLKGLSKPTQSETGSTIRLNDEWSGDPIYYRPGFLIPVAAAGAGAAGLLLLPNGDDEPDSPDRGSTFLGTYDFRANVLDRAACNFVNFDSTVEFGGIESNFTAPMVETGATILFRGTATISPELVEFNTSATGTIAGLGNYTATFAGRILSNRTATGIQTMNFLCGTVIAAQSGTKR